MKKLILIGGPMGAGKTTLANVLSQKLTNSVMLDGDWCWKMNPFTVNDENKQMVMNNIHYLLNSFIHNSQIDYIVFCWVMDEQKIIDTVTSGLDLTDVQVTPVSLLPSMQKLISNIQKDIDTGKRKPDDIQRSLDRMLKFQGLSTIKYDNTDKTSAEIADEIIEQLN